MLCVSHYVLVLNTFINQYLSICTYVMNRNLIRGSSITVRVFDNFE